MHTFSSRHSVPTPGPTRPMEATVAERGQITLPKQVRDALGLTKGSKLKVEIDGNRIVLRKDVDDALSRLRGRIKLPTRRDHRRRDARIARPRPRRPLPAARRQPAMIAIDSSVLIDLIGGDARAAAAEDAVRAALSQGPVVACEVVVSEVVAGLGHGSEPGRPARRGRHRLRAARTALRGARRRNAAALPGASAVGQGAAIAGPRRARLPDRRPRPAAMQRPDHAGRQLLPRLLQGAQGHRARRLPDPHFTHRPTKAPSP